ncbi:MAG: AAA family ATPase [bacterium]
MENKTQVMEDNLSKDSSVVLEKPKLPDNISEIITQVNTAIKFINRQVINREEIIQQSFYALLTGEHQLLLGRTGMAKSLLARQIFCCFENAHIYEKHLTKDTMPDNLFGAYDIEQMKQGKMLHNIEGSLVTNDFAFLDEIFDANDMLLRSLLSLLNEKRFINGQQQVNSPLSSVIGAANYARYSEMLEAVLDRFLYKSYISENKNMYTQLLIDCIYQEHHGSIKQPDQKVQLHEFKLLQKIIKSKEIVISEYILFLKNYILRKYIEEIRAVDPGRSDFTISDRTSVKIQDLLRASAILDHRMEVEEKDLNQMHYLVCTVGKDDDKERLLNTIHNARKYLEHDKEALKDAFQLMQLVNEIKLRRGKEKIIESLEASLIVEDIEASLKGKKGIRQKLQDLKDKINPFANKSELLKLIETMQQYCDLLRQTAARRETLEIIEGVERDIESFQF